jgi:hypothetical protein
MCAMFEGWTPEQVATGASAIAALIGAIAAIASAVFAGIAVRAQRRAFEPRISVKHATPIPVWGGSGRNLFGSKLGEPWFAIVVHNDGAVPVTVRHAALSFRDGGTAPFMGPPWTGADSLPKTLAPGDEATFYLDELRKVAKVHAEHGGAKWVTAKLGGGVEFHGDAMNGKWLDGWVKSGAIRDE